MNCKDNEVRRCLTKFNQNGQQFPDHRKKYYIIVKQKYITQFNNIKRPS